MEHINSEQPQLTVVTPTYNRIKTLPYVYESLCVQTDKRFIWLIVDDGSKDNTRELVQRWILENVIRIKYIYKENGGKASSLNIGLNNLDTPFCVCLDSDDKFYPDTVAMALEELEKVTEDEKCCGLIGLRNNPDGTVMGKREIPQSFTKITAEDIFLRLQLKTELICFYKTGIINKFRFPEFPGEKFVSPAWMQYTISQEYYYKPIWGRFCCCEYIADGLTKNKKKVIIRNPKGYTCVKLYSFNMSPSLKLRVKHGVMYDYGCILSKDKKWMKNAKHKVLAMFLMIPAYALYLDRRHSIGT